MTDLHQRVVQARWLVGSLGEGATPAWWPSEAGTAVGQRMLARIFPRTALAAALQTITRAAEVVHDERIGRRSVYHLFRLPAADETTMHELLTGTMAAELLGPLAALMDRREQMDALRRLAPTGSAIRGVGPQRVGTVEDLHYEKALPLLCAAYAAGFAAAQPVFPYLSPQ